MKKIIWFGSIIAMILAASGCEKNNNIKPEDQMITKVLSVSSQTKTVLQGKDIVWEEDDKVCCVTVYEDDRLDRGRTNIYTNIQPTEMNGSEAKIEVTYGSAYTPKHIIYPSSADVVVCTGGDLDIPVPTSYTMVRNNIPAASNIAVGNIDNDHVYMRNIMTLMKFEVAYPEDMDEETDGIKQIIITSNAGEALGGTLKYDPNTNEVKSTSGSPKVILYPPDDELFFTEGEYYFPLPSITLSQGFKVKLSRMDNWVAEKSYTQECKLGRNKVVNMGETSEWELNYENTIRVISAAISDGSNYLDATGLGWPFTGSRPKISYGELTQEFYLPDNEDAGFRFFVHSSTADSWRSTKGSGFRFGGTAHDYMLLPALPGYRLTSVYIMSGKAVKYAITNNPDSGTPTPVAGGEEKSIGAKSEHTFTLTGTAPNTAYRLDLPTTTEAALYKFTLTYEKE